MTAEGSTALWLPGGVHAELHRRPRCRTGTGLVLVPPFGWDDVASYRVRREWAGGLAHAGHPVLRLDLPGTGDSAGSTRRPQLLQDWTAAVLDATEALRDVGCNRVAVLGLGLGGFAAALAAQDPRVDDLALWAVPSRGRAMVRQLRLAADRLEAGPERSEDDGSLWIFGYPLPATALAELERLDLTALTLSHPGRRVLLLGRDGSSPEPRLIEAFGGLDVRSRPGQGYTFLVEHPQTSVPSREVWGDVRDWLDSAPTSTVRPTPVHRQATVSTDVGGGITERFVQVTTPLGVVQGIVTEPPRPKGLGLVFLNSGATRRPGPNRLYVQAARAAAELGVTSLRWDLPGIGDSPGRSRWTADNAAFYTSARVRKVRAALGVVEQVGLPGRLVLAGLCSGAYWAFTMGQEDPRVRALAMFNPRSLVWDPAAGGVLLDRPSLGTVITSAHWQRLLKDPRARRRACHLLAGAVRRRLPWHVPRGSGASDDPLGHALDRLQAKGTEVVLAFESADRDLLLALQEEGYCHQPQRWPRWDLRVLNGPAGINTSFSPPSLQREFVKIVLEVVTPYLDADVEVAAQRRRRMHPFTAQRPAAPRTPTAG